jgi:general secretion pathway protein L
MNFLPAIKAGLGLWMDCVAHALLAGLDRVTARRPLRLVEQDDGSFSIETASATAPSIQLTTAADLSPDIAALIKDKRAELMLQPRHFLFRPLDLPRRAGEFLDGIVRAQIDRLTPWSVQDAMFGCTRPVDIANDRIALTVAATARVWVRPYVQALTELGAQSVSVSTRFETEGIAADSIVMAEQAGRGAADLSRFRRTALIALLAAAALTAIMTAATSVIGSSLQDEQTEVARQTSERRAALRAGRDVPMGLEAAQQALEQRKRETPASVLLLEALSRALPDDTYLTELRLEGSKLQIVGMTRNAPALIPLIEQSPHFNRAAFFAPTTRAPDNPRENFHIAAQVQPVFTSVP